jgi:predicted  nucleic acid-binding Zn-ribbon protein
MASPEDDKPTADDMMAKIYAWGEDPVKYEAMRDFLLATNSKYIINLRKRMPQMEQQKQECVTQLATFSTEYQQSLSTFEKKMAAMEQKLGEMSTLFSELQIKINTQQNSLDGLKSNMDRSLAGFDSRLQVGEQKAPEVADAVTFINDHKAVLSQFSEMVGKLEVLWELREKGTPGATGKLAAI